MMSKSLTRGVQQVWLLPGESIPPVVLLPVDLGGGHLAIEAIASYKNLRSATEFASAPASLRSECPSIRGVQAHLREAGPLTFSFRHFLRQTPSNASKAFFDSRGAEFGDAVDWRAAENTIARQIAEAMDRMSGDDVAPLVSGLERAHALSDEHGIRALINAAEDPQALLATFDGAENDQERALRILVEDPTVFERAEDIRYFDYRVEGNYGRRFQAQHGATVNRDSGTLEKFQCAVGAYFRSIDGSGRSCVAEVIDRNADGTVQVTLFVEGLASNAVGFDQGGLYRRPQRPAIQAAVVYCGRTGTIETVAKGGKPVHEELRKLFAQQLLCIEPRFDGIRPRRFRLGMLAGRPTLPTDPADGIERARVRRLKLLPTANRPGAVVIEGPSDRPDVSAQGLSADWFQDWDPVARGFHIVQATISIHFRSIDGRRPRTIHLDLTSLGSSNLKRFKQDDRILLERYLERWRLIEPNE